MRFIHCADLHIGKGQNGSSERYDDFFGAFSQLAEAAAEFHVDFVAAAGDLFDMRAVNSDTLWRMTEILHNLKEKGIEVFAVEGNHDRSFYYERESWLGYLNNMSLLKLLKPDIAEAKLVLSPYDGKTGAIYENGSYRVIGLGYFGALTKKRIEEAALAIEKKDKYTVVLLHAALQSQMSQDMAGVEKDCLLSLKDVSDYLALGHIHKRYESGDFLYNPGSLEYVDSAEARRRDEKGFFLVDTEDGGLPRFFPVRTRQHVFVAVDISGAAEEDEVWRRVLAGIEKMGSMEDPVIEVELTGESPFETYKLNTAGLEEEVKSRFGAISVSIDTYLVNAPGREAAPAVVDRAELEKSVMRQIMRDAGYGDALAESLTEFALSIKAGVGVGFSGEEIADMAEQLLLPEHEEAL
jgi:exonuclease SbcD